MIKLLDGKISFLTTAMNVCMLWWVSSVVFCGSVLSTTFMKRNAIKAMRNLNWFLAIVAFFFLTIVLFGSWVGVTMLFERSETSQVLALLSLPRDLYRTEYLIFEGAIWVGTSSFVLVLITWIGIWKHLRIQSRAYKEMREKVRKKRDIGVRAHANAGTP